MKRSKDEEYRVVYTTVDGSVCPGCKRPKLSCSCQEERKSQVLGDGNVKVRRETAGRGGKTVTTVYGLALTRGELEAMLKDLKRVCGAGGALKEGTLELQGDHCDVIIRELARRGIRAKRAGG